jgi:2-phosphoglycolate phosphatase
VGSRSSTLPEKALRAPRAIVFDLDGTLVDSRGDIADACNHALTAFGRAVLPEGTIAGFVGDGAKKLLARAFGEGISNEELAAAYETFSHYYASHAAVRSRWMPGAREVVLALAPMPLAIATNKPRDATTSLLRALSAESFFARVISGDDGALKPSPDPIRAALLPTGVVARDAWVVGDGVQDVLAARAAGATSIAVLGGFSSEATLSASQPDAMIDSLHDLLPLTRRGRATS